MVLKGLYLLADNYGNCKLCKELGEILQLTTNCARIFNKSNENYLKEWHNSNILSVRNHAFQS